METQDQSNKSWESSKARNFGDQKKVWSYERWHGNVWAWKCDTEETYQTQRRKLTRQWIQQVKHNISPSSELVFIEERLKID